MREITRREGFWLALGAVLAALVPRWADGDRSAVWTCEKGQLWQEVAPPMGPFVMDPFQGADDAEVWEVAVYDKDGKLVGNGAMDSGLKLAS